MPTEKSDLLQGTLDMLILKVVALGPLHGMASRSAFARFPGRRSRCSRVPCIAHCIVSEKRGWLDSSWRESENRQTGEVLPTVGKGLQAVGE